MSESKSGLSDLIEALTIFKKYGDAYAPTHCEHDELMVCAGITCEAVSEEDRDRLKQLGFDWNRSLGHWYSFRFGSC